MRNTEEIFERLYAREKELREQIRNIAPKYKLKGSEVVRVEAGDNVVNECYKILKKTTIKGYKLTIVFNGIKTSKEFFEIIASSHLTNEISYTTKVGSYSTYEQALKKYDSILKEARNE